MERLSSRTGLCRNQSQFCREWMKWIARTAQAMVERIPGGEGTHGGHWSGRTTEADLEEMAKVWEEWEGEGGCESGDAAWGDHYFEVGK